MCLTEVLTYLKAYNKLGTLDEIEKVFKVCGQSIQKMQDLQNQLEEANNTIKFLEARLTAALKEARNTIKLLEEENCELRKFVATTHIGSSNDIVFYQSSTTVRDDVFDED